MDTVEMTGKTPEEAIEKALAALEAKQEDVTIEIIDQGAKGFLGIGHKPAKVLVTLKYDPTRFAKQFIRDISAAMGLTIAVDVKQDSNGINIDLKGDGMGVLIGKHGQTLDSLQYLTNLAVNKNTESYINIVIDTENYREKRKETLESLARNMARKAKQTKKPVKLEPMSPSERRVIHASLQGEKGITTFSEGVEPFRNVVISPKREYGSYQDRNAHSPESSDRSFQKPYQNKFKSGPRQYQKTDNYKKFITVDNKAPKNYQNNINEDEDL